MAEMRIPRRSCFAALASFALALGACSSEPSTSTGGHEAAPERPTIAGSKAYGPFVELMTLGATAWDGQRVWLTDNADGRLLAIDGDSGDVIIDRQLESDVSDSSNMAVSDGELWATGKGPENDVQVLRIVTRTGEVNATDVDSGHPRGQALRRAETLVVADYERRIVAVDPRTGATSVLVDLDVVPNLLQFAPADTYWIVDDSRARLLRVDANGTALVDSHRPSRKAGTTIVAALVADQAGNAWLAERTAVTSVNPAGETIRELGGFKNVTLVLACDGAVVASDVETGELAWLDATGRDQRVTTGTSGRAIACAPGGVWFVTDDGYLARVTEPSR